jgi:NAD(P)H-nitrite reductase large subunit
MNNKKYIIIGNSAAGIAAIRTLRSLDPHATIICFSDELEKPYNKCFLADYISGDKSEQQTYTLKKEQLDQLSIDMRYGMAVVGINPQGRYITLKNSAIESYDALLLATGTRPIVPNIEHIGSYSNVFAFHSLKSAHQLSSFIQERKPQKAVVIGAGLSGVEIADALTRHNIAVHLVERSEYLLSAHLTAKASQFLESAMHKSGVHVHANKTVLKVEGDGDTAQSVILSDGTVIKTDLIVMTAGLVRNAELARNAGLTVDQYGLVVNENLQTSDQYIYAAGDIISTVDQISGRAMASCTWPDAMQQGRYAAYAMAGQSKPYPGASIITSSAFFGLKFYSCGAKDDSALTVIERSDDHCYRRYLLQGDKLKGFILLDDGKKFAQLKAILLTGQPINNQLID